MRCKKVKLQCLNSIVITTNVSICNYIDMEKNEILKMFGKNLSAERNRAGYSQDELAEKWGFVRENILET